MMKYFVLEPYADIEVLDGESIPTRPCHACGRTIGTGQVNLRVRAPDDTSPDALAVMDGPEWTASPRLKALIEGFGEAPVEFLPVTEENGGRWTYEQVLVRESLPAGRQSVVGGKRCSACGGDVRLRLRPLYLTPTPQHQPLVATLRESSSVILVREDLRAAMLTRRLDVSLVPAYFDGEPVPQANSTFEGQDWSDV